MELNAVTDLNLVMSVQQVSLLTSLQQHLASLLPGPSDAAPPASRPGVQDSGVDCDQPSSSGREHVHSIPGLASVPLEVLLTCNSLRVAVHKYERGTEGVTQEDVRMWRRYLHADRRAPRQGRRVSEDSQGTETEEGRREVNVLEEVVKLESSETEEGYEASEEESCVEARISSSVRLVPLCSITLTHPHIFCSLSSSQQKLDLSVYNLLLACAPPGFHLPASAAKKIPCARDFPTTLLETRPGKADPKSGIRPALVTVTVTEVCSSSPELAAKVERPVQVVMGRERWGQLVRLGKELRGLVEEGASEDGGARGEDGPREEERVREEKGAREEVDKVLSLPARRVSVSTVQLVGVWEEREGEACSVRVSLAGLHASLELDEQTEGCSLAVSATVERLTASLNRSALVHQLLDPLSLSVKFSKMLLPGVPLLERAHTQLELQQLQLHLGPHHLHVLKKLTGSLELAGESEEFIEADGETCSGPVCREEEELHYQDDLRAGAFQFLDPVLEGAAENPAPYQVVCDSSSLTWCYPQPRTLTRVVIFPLPFVEASEFSFSEGGGERVDCELLHWADTLQSFVVYSSFQLSESQVVHLDLPLLRDRRACSASTTWRVRLSRQADQAYISPLGLVSVLKVDSFSSPRLLPSSSLSVRCSSLLLHLHNHLHYAGQELSPGLPLADLALDTSFPADQVLATLTVSPVALGASLWPQEEGGALVQASAKARLGIQYADQTFLALHQLLAPVECQLGLQVWRGQPDITASLGPTHLAAGPLFLHAARQSARLWEQVLERLGGGATEEPGQFIPLAQVMLVNETGQVMRFGQAGTEENILVEPRHSAPYVWRSQRASQRLRVAVEGRDWTWSQAFPVQEGRHTVTLGQEAGLQALVQVEAVTPSLKLVRVSGLLSLLCLLREHLELRILPPTGKETRCLIGSYSRPTSVVCGCQGLVLKVRLLGLATPWSGDIPLEAPVGRRKSFMVKLPLKEKGSSCTVWCSILTEKLDGELRQLVIFSPLYVLSSLLPSPLSVCASLPGQQTPVIQVSAPPLGASLQLDVPAPPETKFNLSFTASPSLPPSSPSLAVSWGIIDQVREKGRPLPSIDEVLASSPQFNLRAGPKDPALQELAGLKVASQPRTDCKVTFTEFHPVTNTLCIRVCPPLLLVNRCSLPLLSRQSGQSSWLLEPHSVFQPPPMGDAKFQLGLQERGGAEAWGGELELSEQDWTYMSIRPGQHSGVVHLHGSLQYSVQGGGGRATAFLTLESSVSEGVRILTLRPALLLANRTGEEVTVQCQVKPELTVQNRAEVDWVPGQLETVAAAGGSVLALFWWPQTARGAGHLGHHVSLARPGQLPGPLLSLPLDRDSRHCLALPEGDTDSPVLLISHQHRGQTFLLVLEDREPQALLHNLLPLALAWREEGRRARCGAALPGQSRHLTLPWLQEGYPYCEQGRGSKRIQFSLEGEPGSQAANWSSGIDLTSTQETFIALPGHGDIRVRVEALHPTSHLFIEPVSNLEVAARDIRARFGAASPSSPEPVYLSPDSSYVTVPSRDNSALASKEQSFRTTLEESMEEEDSQSAVSSSYSFVQSPLSSSPGPVLCVRVSELSLALTDDLLHYPDLQEVLRLTVQELEVRAQPSTDFSTVFRALGDKHLQTQELTVRLQEVQVDNQLFRRGLFHFPVLVSRQDSSNQHSPMVEARLSLVQGRTRQFRLQLQPLALCLEDQYVYQLQRFLAACTHPQPQVPSPGGDEELLLPPPVLFAVESSSRMVYHQKVVLEQVDLQVSAHASVKVFVGVEDSKISLARLEVSEVWATWYSLGHRSHNLLASLHRKNLKATI